MPVAVQMDIPDATLEQYDQIRERIGLVPGGPGPTGAISHFVAATDVGLRIVDVWESREAFDRFAEETIGPNAEAVGMPAEPSMRFFEVQNHHTPGPQSVEPAGADTGAPAAMTREDLVRLDDAHLSAWNQHNADAFAGFLGQEFVWRDVTMPDPITTPAGAREYVDAWFTAFPDMVVRTTNRVVGDGSVAAEIEFTGTNTGTLQMGETAVPATGLSVVGRGCYFMRAEGGRIVEFSTHPDVAGLLVQLGLMPPAPAAGTTTEAGAQSTER